VCRDDQILFNALIFYIGQWLVPESQKLPIWRTSGVVMTILLHSGPVEFLYYWLHRALHHHFLYSRYHSHHHSSIVTEPITCEFILFFVFYFNFFLPPPNNMEIKMSRWEINVDINKWKCSVKLFTVIV
jgi:aldehyde decarbonylase